MTILIGLCLLSVMLVPLVNAGVSGGVVNVTLALDHEAVMNGFRGIKEYYASIGDNAERKLVKVVSATRQVVAGLLYDLKLEISKGKKSQNCEIHVWLMPWLKSPKNITFPDPPVCKDK